MAEPARDELPLADYDHLPVPALRDRIRSLTEEQLQRLLDYEHAHGDRQPVVTVLRTRMDEVREGAPLSPGGDQDTRPDQPEATRHGSPVSSNATAQPIHPPPQGLAGHHGKPKGDREVGE